MPLGSWVGCGGFGEAVGSKRWVGVGGLGLAAMLGLGGGLGGGGGAVRFFDTPRLPRGLSAALAC